MRPHYPGSTDLLIIMIIDDTILKILVPINLVYQLDKNITLGIKQKDLDGWKEQYGHAKQRFNKP